MKDYGVEVGRALAELRTPGRPQSDIEMPSEEALCDLAISFWMGPLSAWDFSILIAAWGSTPWFAGYVAEVGDALADAGLIKLDRADARGFAVLQFRPRRGVLVPSEKAQMAASSGAGVSTSEVLEAEDFRLAYHASSGVLKLLLTPAGLPAAPVGRAIVTLRLMRVSRTGEVALRAWTCTLDAGGVGQVALEDVLPEPAVDEAYVFEVALARPQPANE